MPTIISSPSDSSLASVDCHQVQDDVFMHSNICKQESHNTQFIPEIHLVISPPSWESEESNILGN